MRSFSLLPLATLLALQTNVAAQSLLPPFRSYELQPHHLDDTNFVIGPYRVRATANLSPWSGQPGDPRRSRFLVLTIPTDMLFLPLTLKKKLPRLNVVKLSLEPDDATRLAGYADVIEAGPVVNYDGYTGHHLSSASELYVAPPGRTPSYVVCPLPLGKTYMALSPMLCNVDTTVASAGKGTSDLTIAYVFRDDNWTELPALIDALKLAIGPPCRYRAQQRAVASVKRSVTRGLMGQITYSPPPGPGPGD